MPVNHYRKYYLQLLVWNDVSTTPIVSTNLRFQRKTTAIKDEDDPFKEMNEKLKKLREKDSSLALEFRVLINAYL